MSLVDYMKSAGNMELTGFCVRGTSIFKSQKVKVLNHCMIVFTFLLFFFKKKKIFLSLDLDLIKTLAMEAAFEKIFCILSELLRMQEFWEFTNKVHTLAKCTEKNCSIEGFFKKIKEVIFDEEFSYDKRRLFFHRRLQLKYVRFQCHVPASSQGQRKFE